MRNDHQSSVSGAEKTPRKRVGPRPLTAHFMTLWSHLSPQSPALEGGEYLPQEAVEKYAQKYDQDLKKISIQNINKFLQAVDLYQKEEKEIEPITGEVVWQDGASSLYHFAAKAKREDEKNAPIFIVPSLINTAKILDLSQGRSLCRWLAEQGHDVYLLEWGNPDEKATDYDLDDYLSVKLFPAFDYVCMKHECAKPHVIGFCMGGIFALALSVIRQDQCRSVAFLATPWDFHIDQEDNAKNVVHYLAALKKFKPARKTIAIDEIQMMFVGLSPLRVFEKFCRIDEYYKDAEKWEYFLAMEDWVNDGMALPIKIADEIMGRWYGENTLVHDGFIFKGQTITPEDVKVPSCFFIGTRDQLVKPASSRVMAARIKDSVIVDIDKGHTGMIAGDDAAEKLWKNYKNWLSSLPQEKA